MSDTGRFAVEGDWERDGAVCIRGAFPPDEQRQLEHCVDANLADLSPLSKRASSATDGAFVEDFCSWTRIPELEDFVRHSVSAQIAAQLLGSETVRFYHDHLLVKEPGTAQRTPWHQDQPYYNVDGTRNVSLWIPVDPVPRESTLEFIAGTHKGPWFLPRTFLDGYPAWFPEHSLAEPPDFDADPDAWPRIGWALETGDAVAFNMLTVHGSAGTTDNRRRVLSLRFLGDDMVHAPRPWATSPPFPTLADELAPGGPMDHPLFPIVWPQNKQG